MFHQQSTRPENMNFACNQGAEPLYKMIKLLDKNLQYPFDDHLVELLYISRTVDESDFLIGNINSRFIEMAASKCDTCVLKLFEATQDERNPLHKSALYTFAAYSSGKKGIDDVLRYFRWKYYEMMDDAAGLEKFNTKINGFRAAALGEYFLDHSWEAYLKNSDKSVLKIMFGPFDDEPSNDISLNKADALAAVGGKICDWLGLKDSKVTAISEYADLSRFSLSETGSYVSAEIVFPDIWSWPHRSEREKIVLNTSIS